MGLLEDITQALADRSARQAVADWQDPAIDQLLRDSAAGPHAQDPQVRSLVRLQESYRQLALLLDWCARATTLDGLAASAALHPGLTPCLPAVLPRHQQEAADVLRITQGYARAQVAMAVSRTYQRYAQIGNDAQISSGAQNGSGVEQQSAQDTILQRILDEHVRSVEQVALAVSCRSSETARRPASGRSTHRAAASDSHDSDAGVRAAPAPQDQQARYLARDAACHALLTATTYDAVEDALRQARPLQEASASVSGESDVSRDTLLRDAITYARGRLPLLRQQERDHLQARWDSSSASERLQCWAWYQQRAEELAYGPLMDAMQQERADAQQTQDARRLLQDAMPLSGRYDDRMTDADSSDPRTGQTVIDDLARRARALRMLRGLRTEALEQQIAHATGAYLRDSRDAWQQACQEIFTHYQDERIPSRTHGAALPSVVDSRQGEAGPQGMTRAIRRFFGVPASTAQHIHSRATQPHSADGTTPSAIHLDALALDILGVTSACPYRQHAENPRTDNGVYQSISAPPSRPRC